MIDLIGWQWGGEYPTNIWIRVLMAHNEDEVAEATARLNHGGTGRFWTMAPGEHIWGPIVGWRPLLEGEPMGPPSIRGREEAMTPPDKMTEAEWDRYLRWRSATDDRRYGDGVTLVPADELTNRQSLPPQATGGGTRGEPPAGKHSEFCSRAPSPDASDTADTVKRLRAGIPQRHIESGYFANDDAATKKLLKKAADAIERLSANIDKEVYSRVEHWRSSVERLSAERDALEKINETLLANETTAQAYLDIRTLQAHVKELE